MSKLNSELHLIQGWGLGIISWVRAMSLSHFGTHLLLGHLSSQTALKENTALCGISMMRMYYSCRKEAQEGNRIILIEFTCEFLNFEKVVFYIETNGKLEFYLIFNRRSKMSTTCTTCSKKLLHLLFMHGIFTHVSGYTYRGR